ncbi:MAG TPA: glycosyltransferase family 4 protein [Devosia sp.]|nr:glycosyltransferase family 4 protein [Devosia sp.]
MGSVTRLIAQWLDEKRAAGSVAVIDPRGDGAAIVWPFFLVVAAARLLALRIAGRADIVHLQVSERSSLVRKGLLLRLAKAIGMKTVLHHHGAEFIDYYRSSGAATKGWVRRTVTLADANIVLGERWARFLRDEIGAMPGRIHVLYNATRDIRRPDGVPALPSGERHILLAANLSPRKGVSEFLQALKRLAADHPGLRATLAGGGEVDRYRAEAKALGLDGVVRFTGWIDHASLVQLLWTADAMVLPSYDEGLPMVILEALSAGVPVVATPVGSIPEVLTDGQTCLLVEPGNVDALKIAMERVVFEDDFGQGLAERGRQLYESQFDLDRYMERLLQIYAGLDDPSGGVR